MIGTRLAHYQITNHLGTGGMGEVYQATDSKLGRRVAIKFLPGTLASDAERLSRFRREAQVLASLNHSNIAQIYGLEESGGTCGIVMELVKGETLQARLQRGPVPVNEALTIAKQIAEALEAAHEKGVVHRDLKPGNVMLTTEGKVKVLDFGLAKAFESSQPNVNLSNSPTIASMAATNAGVILGTAAYMSPEQARGKPIDKRTDIWAFGCVLYEMLSGNAAFQGETTSDILAKILERSPDIDKVRGHAPARIVELIERCLQKDRSERLHDIGDARIEITRVGPMPADERPVRIRRLHPAWIVSLVLLAAVAVLTVLLMKSTRSGVDSARDMSAVSITLPEKTSTTGQPAISPDGRRVAFSTPEGLWVRPIDSFEAKRLDSMGGEYPFWSPDGKSIGFSAGGKLRIVDSSGGPVQTLGDSPANFLGGTWSFTGAILYSNGGTLTQVSASPGSPASRKYTDEIQPAFPYFLPDGKHFLFANISGQKEPGIYVGSLDSEGIQRILAVPSMPVYTPSGFILFLQQGRLMAQRFDVEKLSVSGDPIKVADGIANRPGCGCAYFSATSDIIAYRAGPNEEMVQLTWFDRSGRPAGAIGKPDTVVGVRISPDGRRIAVNKVDVESHGIDLWLIDDIERGVPSPFTFDGDAIPVLSAVWSPDGRVLAYNKFKGGTHLKETVGNGDEKPFKPNLVQDWSLDGKYLIGIGMNPGTGQDLALIPVAEGEEITWFKAPLNQGHSRISPDSKWLAYASDESGQLEIYVQRFPKPDARPLKVSSGGGIFPRWSGNSRELFYVSLDSKVMSVSISPGDSLQAAPPRPLFDSPKTGEPTLTALELFDVAPDGQRFVIAPEGKSASSSVSLIFNWSAVLKR